MIDLGIHLECTDERHGQQPWRNGIAVATHRGDDQRQTIAHCEAEPKCHGNTHDHACGRTLEVTEKTVGHVLVDNRQWGLEFGIDTVERGDDDHAAAGEHGFCFIERCRSYHLGMLAETFGHLFPVLEHPGSRDEHVRNGAKNPVLQLSVESVHHRQHQREHGNA
ncbi:MAG: hypothetical protein V3T15_07685 [Pseudomonadales bacterium]